MKQLEAFGIKTRMIRGDTKSYNKRDEDEYKKAQRELLKESLRYNDVKAKEVRTAKLVPVGTYKYKQQKDGYGEWNTPSGNSPMKLKKTKYEYDFGT